MTTKLSLYNGALRLCKQRKLASLDENREPRRLLDDAWGDGSTTGSVKRCLELGQWTHAMKSAMLDYAPEVEPSFGYRRAFTYPSDFVRLSAICEDEYFKQPLLEYSAERGYWYADLETIFVKFVSNDAEYGADLSLWTESFAKLVEADLAREIVGSLTGADSDAVEKAFQEAKKNAPSLDASNSPTKFAPMGSWASTRRYGYRDRGNRGSLLG